MQIGMVGLGRMGAGMVRRLMRAGHECVVYDVNAAAVASVASDGARGTASLDEFIALLTPPRVAWMMVPAAAVDQTLAELSRRCHGGDIIVDGGNSHYVDDIVRAGHLGTQGIHYVDVGTSGGVWGLERGFCQMIGGEADVVRHLEPIFTALAPPADAVSPTPNRRNDGSTAAHGYLHCGPSGAGHFVKMVHNGIEYGLMAAYAEGLNILRHANAGMQAAAVDAETAPLRNPDAYQYTFNIGDITEVWRRGSVISSWLLDLTANALAADPDMTSFEGRVADSGEGRWTINAAVDEGVPVPVLSAALYARFSSRGHSDFADRLLSAMRAQFGGHVERTR
jgi:6-phosphogluconate dehydrogenase